MILTYGALLVYASWHRCSGIFRTYKYLSRLREVAGELIPDILCGMAQLAEAPTDYLNNVRDGLLGTNSDSDGTAAGFESPIQKALCNLGANPNQPAFDQSPPAQGNCRVRYRLASNVTYNPRFGPDSLITERITSGDNSFAGPLGEPFLGPDNVNGNGRIQWPSAAGSNLSQIIFNYRTGTYGDIEFTNSIERVDGQPDNCNENGDPLPPTTDGPPGGSGDITYDDENNNPITEPYTFSPRPIRRSPNGDSIAPFEICVAGVCYEICYNLSTGTSQACTGGQANDPCCPTVDDSEPGEPGTDDPPPPENDERFAGVLIRSTITSFGTEVTEIGNGIGPSLWIPRLAVVRFAVQIGGRNTWTVDQDVKTLSQAVFVNAPALAYDYDVIEKPGITTEVTPLFAPATIQ